MKQFFCLGYSVELANGLSNKKNLENPQKILEFSHLFRCSSHGLGLSISDICIHMYTF